MNLHLNCVSNSGENIDSFCLYQTPTKVTWEVLGGEGIFIQTGIEPYLSRYIKWRNPPQKINSEDKQAIREIMLKNGFKDYKINFVVDTIINEDDDIMHIEALNHWVEKNKNKGIIEWNAQ